MTPKCVDGGLGAGGGQVLRSALALSMVTGTPIRLEQIRAGRSRPGLMRQHLTAVEAAGRICGAQVEGALLGSRELLFRPGRIQGGEYGFAVGTAGSACLVLQTVLPALLAAPSSSTLTVEGGTHNPAAPPFDFLERVFLPLITRMGAHVRVELERAGFYPAGGGRIRVEVAPLARWKPLELLERGEIQTRRARAIISRLPERIAERELRTVQQKLGWTQGELETVGAESPGPGNVLLLEVASDEVREIFTGFGERGVPAESVASRAVDVLQQYLAAGVPVGRHLADQLLLPLALAGSGSFRTLPLSRHSTTNIAVIEQFLPVRIQANPEDTGNVRVEVEAA